MRIRALLTLLMAAPLVVLADDIVLDWDADPRATSYRVHASTDGGDIWAQIAESTTLPITVTVGNSGLVLLRACAVNATGEACRDETGFFHNGDWAIRPTNLATP